MRNLFQRDDLDGALFGAGAAIGALFGIDGGEEILVHIMQPMQPAEQTLRTTAPLSWLEQRTVT